MCCALKFNHFTYEIIINEDRSFWKQPTLIPIVGYIGNIDIFLSFYRFRFIKRTCPGDAVYNTFKWKLKNGFNDGRKEDIVRRLFFYLIF